ncbi:MAG: hypothetical protein KAV68_06780 [Dehalococcoidales bacterium]|nr:hypothetical protein [Dehalococcoidales bacterium]
MTTNTETKLIGGQSIVHILLGILVFGSIWGFLEATLGGFLHMIIFPNKGAIMGGIGVAIMASALAIYKKPSMLPGIGIVAALFKLLDIWLFALPIASIHIINPAMAIIFESLAFSLLAVFVMKKMAKNALVGVGAGALAGLVSATAWVYFAIYVMNAPAYARVVFTAGGFIANQGVAQAAFFGIFVPLGYLAGVKLAAKTFPALTRRSLYYATSAAIICFCWGISAIAKMAGL